MIYESPYLTKINFTPWFEKSYRLRCLHIFEELGGNLAHGTIDMEMNGGQDALDLMNKCNTGQITIEREGGFIYTIDIVVLSRTFSMNYVTLNFVCIKDGKFVSEKKNEVYTDINDAIKALYPGNIDIRCETDIQGGDIKYYRNMETSQSFLTNLCRSFKKQSIFAFGWEGLMIKETMGAKNSRGKNDPDLFSAGTIDKEFIDRYSETYNPELFNLPYNPWEDTEAKHIDKDFTDKEAINVRAITRFGNTVYVQTPYQQLYENRTYNDSYYNSSFFQSFRIIEQDIPKYKIGDVLGYMRNDQTHPDSHTWPYKYYLVRSNEFFCSTDHSNKVDFKGNKFSFLTKLVGLEKDGSIALDKDIDEDPIINPKE